MPCRNPDGSVELLFGLEPSAGREMDWVPTKAGNRFEMIFLLYGPEKPVFDKSWVSGDVEPIG